MLGRRMTTVVTGIAVFGVVVALVGLAVVGTKSILLGAVTTLCAVHVMMAAVVVMLVRDIRPDIRGWKRVGAIAAYIAIFGLITVGVLYFQVDTVLRAW